MWSYKGFWNIISGCQVWHCIKSVRIRSYGLHLPAYGLNTERYGVSVGRWENVDQNNSEYGHFLRSVMFKRSPAVLQVWTFLKSTLIKMQTKHFWSFYWEINFSSLLNWSRLIHNFNLYLQKWCRYLRVLQICSKFKN